MGKVTFLSLPPTCWKELFNCVCLAVWSGAPSSFSACASLLVQRVSVSYHGPWLLCVCGNSCCHIFIVEPWAAPASSSQGSRLGQIVGESVPARLTEPYLARTWARLHRALALFSLLTGLLSPPKPWPSSAAGSHVRKNIREILERG